MNTMDYLTKGCVTADMQEIASIVSIYIDHATWSAEETGGFQATAEDNPDMFAFLEQVSAHMIRRMAGLLFTNVEVVRTYVMKGYDADSVIWHNDQIEGHNMTLVLHMRDLTEDTGGWFQMRSTATNEIVTLIPKRGTAIMFSHAPLFEHRVVPIVGDAERIAIFFDCKVY